VVKSVRNSVKNVEMSVGIWIRVSTEDQVRGESPEHHEKRARLYAESKGWNVKKVYHLEAVSGKTVIDRPETKEMLHDIRTGYISGLIFSKLARLARNTKELLEFAEIFREYNADLISLQESIDTSSPAGRLFYTMIAAMAQWEREEIAERVAVSVPIRAKLGKPLGGQAPFGYSWIDKKLVPNPKEAPVLKLLFDLFLHEKRKRTVARELNTQGYRTRNGSKFSDTTIRRLLSDPTSRGQHRLNHTKSLGANKKWIQKPEHDWIMLPVEPIISEELWNSCNSILQEQERTNKKPTRKPRHLFTGLVFCSCGQKMYVPSNSPKYSCSKCKNKIGTTDLEEIFHEQLKEFVFSPDEITQYFKEADQTIAEKEKLLKTLSDELETLEKETDGFLRLYMDKNLSSDEFGKRNGPLSERKGQINDQIPELQGEIDFLKIQFLSSDQILADAKDLYTRWPELTPDDKRTIADTITEKISIGENDIQINLQYLPQSPKMVAIGQHNLRGS
jgi:site-specific DNA recombinase